MEDLARVLLSPNAARTTLWLLDGFDELRDAAELAGLWSQRHGTDDVSALRSPPTPVALAPAPVAVLATAPARVDELSSAPDPAPAPLGDAPSPVPAVASPWGPLGATVALLRVLLAQPRVVLTTRPRFREQLGLTHFLEVEPLTTVQVDTFIDKALDGDRPALERLRRSLKASPALAEAIRVPVIMQMAVSVERTGRRPVCDACPIASIGPPSCVVTSLYERLLRAMRARFEDLWVKLPIRPHAIPDRSPAEAWAAALPVLQCVALAGCVSGSALLRWPSRDECLLAVLQAARIIDVVRGGIHVEFAHRSVQEFFAATEVLRRPHMHGAALDSEACAALAHASNDTLRRFAFGLAPNAVNATAILSALGVSNQAVLPVGPTLEVVASCLPHFRGLRDLPLARTVRAAADTFWAAAERGELQASRVG